VDIGKLIIYKILKYQINMSEKIKFEKPALDLNQKIELLKER
jgi:hypothetical protein